MTQRKEAKYNSSPYLDQLPFTLFKSAKVIKMHFTSTLLPALATLSLTTALPALNNPTLEAGKIACATNKYYSVADGDTATSISMTEKVSTLDFMSVNNLGPHMRITPLETLCVPFSLKKR